MQFPQSRHTFQDPEGRSETHWNLEALESNDHAGIWFFCKNLAEVLKVLLSDANFVAGSTSHGTSVQIVLWCH